MWAPPNGSPKILCSRQREQGSVVQAHTVSTSIRDQTLCELPGAPAKRDKIKPHVILPRRGLPPHRFPIQRAETAGPPDCPPIRRPQSPTRHPALLPPTPLPP